METIRGDTAEGRAWLAKYLHPPSQENQGAVTGLPDRDSSPSAVLEWRVAETLGPGGITLNANSGDTWSGVLVSLPNPSTLGIFFTWKTGTFPRFDQPSNPTNYIVQWIQNPAFDFSTVVGKSTAPVGPDRSVVSRTQWSNAVSRYRMIARSTTVEMDVPELYKQGYIYSSQFQLGETHVFGQAFQTTTPPSTPLDWDVYQVLRLDQIPIDGSFILQMSDKAYSGHAKEGVYLPYAFSSGDTSYVDSIMESSIGLATRFQGDPSGFQAVVGLLPGLDPKTTLNPATYLGMTAGITLFTGLHPTASLRTKDIVMVECRSTLFGPWTPFVNPGAPPDPAAMEQSYLARYHMQDAYPAKANFLGGFVSGITSLAPKLKQMYQKNKSLIQSGVSLLPGGAMVNQALDAAEKLVEDLQAQQKGGLSKSKKKALQQDEVQEEAAITRALPKAKKKKSVVSTKRRGA